MYLSLPAYCYLLEIWLFLNYPAFLLYVEMFVNIFLHWIKPVRSEQNWVYFLISASNVVPKYFT